MLRIIIRVDASTVIGSGHMMRCLTLAERFRQMGHHVSFIMRAHCVSMEHVVDKQDFSYKMLPAPMHYDGDGYAAWLGVTQRADAADTVESIGRAGCDLLVVDHYALDRTWEEAIRPYARRIFVIDDLANRRHSCDFLLDANAGAEQSDKYAGLLSPNCHAFLGLSYLLLRQEFYEAGDKSDALTKASSQEQTVFICFGGSDLSNETMRTLRILAKLPQQINAHIVLGASNPYRSAVEDFCSVHHWQVYCQIDYVARLMRDSDCAIGAGGTMTWERCYLGLPTLVVAVAENQREDACLYDRMGIISYAGYCTEITDAEYETAIISFLDDRQRQESLRVRGRAIFENGRVDEMLEEVTASAASWEIQSAPYTAK